MEVEINKRTVTVDEAAVPTLAALLKAERLDGPAQAVAVDNTLAPRSQWAEIPLREGMKITVIRAVCGG